MPNLQEQKALGAYADFKLKMAEAKATIQTFLEKECSASELDIQCVFEAIDEAAKEEESFYKDSLDLLGVCYD